MEEGVRVPYVRWDEVVVSNNKGRRLVHYYLIDAGGGEDLAVVGRERSIRHMKYAVPGRFLRSLMVKPPCISSASSSSSSSVSLHDGVSLKWKTRREVIDWLSSLVSDSVSNGTSPMMGRYNDDEDVEPTNVGTSKGSSSRKMGHPSKEFSWLGPTWKCEKGRKHYSSFSRHGVAITVYDFVYVIAEDHKRLVAYVEDLYEDLRGNNMVSVRCFVKVDEVAIVLPPDVNDREIFYSFCCQDLSIECIDGLATVLGPQDFDKCRSKARQITWEPYMCRSLIYKDDIKPFDITQVRGYWKQGLVRSLYSPSLKVRFKISHGESYVSRIEPKKKSPWDNETVGPSPDSSKPKGLGCGGKSESPRHLRKELLKEKLYLQHLALGSQIEVLSQDSGIRGCWFCCTILKKHHDKVKVQYQDVQDAEDTGKLEEWILASKVAASDKLGIHLHGRPIVRPLPSQIDGSFDVGTIVDAWWNGGWWEGIVIVKESEEKLHVYFQGEKRISIFGQGDLRHSQDWVGRRWSPIKDRQDIAISLSNGLDYQIGGDLLLSDRQPESLPPRDKDACLVTAESEGGEVVPDLLRQCRLNGLNWGSLKKRKLGRKSAKTGSGSGCKRQCHSCISSSQGEVADSNSSGVTFEQEICNQGRVPLFGTLMSRCSSLVMSS